MASRPSALGRVAVDEYAAPPRPIGGEESDRLAVARVVGRKEESPRRPDIFDAMAARGPAILEPRPFEAPPKWGPKDLLELRKQ